MRFRSGFGPVANGTPALWVITCRMVVPVLAVAGVARAGSRRPGRRARSAAFDQHVYDGRRSSPWPPNDAQNRVSVAAGIFGVQGIVRAVAPAVADGPVQDDLLPLRRRHTWMAGCMPAWYQCTRRLPDPFDRCGIDAGVVLGAADGDRVEVGGTRMRPPLDARGRLPRRVAAEVVLQRLTDRAQSARCRSVRHRPRWNERARAVTSLAEWPDRVDGGYAAISMSRRRRSACPPDLHDAGRMGQHPLDRPWCRARGRNRSRRAAGRPSSSAFVALPVGQERLADVAEGDRSSR